MPDRVGVMMRSIIWLFGNIGNRDAHGEFNDASHRLKYKPRPEARGFRNVDQKPIRTEYSHNLSYTQQGAQDCRNGGKLDDFVHL